MSPALANCLAGRFRRDERDDDGSRQQRTYAAVWIVITAARQIFIYGCQHWFTRDLGMFLIDNHISVAAFADSIMFLALAPVVANRLAILIRSRTVTSGGYQAATPLDPSAPSR